MKNILAICGSLRAKSTNLTIIEKISEMFAERISVNVYRDLANLPQFNPDLDTENPPTEVRNFRERVRKADGVLICTPEYVFSIPGALKNALEWTVSSSDFSGKPTAVITASGLGETAHESLLLVLKTIEAKINEQMSLLISGARTKIKVEGVSDEAAIESIKNVIESFIQVIGE